MKWWPFRRAESIEKRAAASGFTSEIVAARAAYIAGRSGLGELTATVQACVSLWENGLSMSDISGTDLVTRRSMALIGRSLAVRGEALFKITEGGLIPAAAWDLATRDAKPRSYRISLSEAAGGRTETLLAAETLHIVIGADPAAPWLGSAPLRRACLTAGLLNAIESALSEVYEYGPLGSMIIPFPESAETDLEALGRGFRGRRGRVLLRESVKVSAAGGPGPSQDWRPESTSPDLSRSMMAESLTAARDAICSVFGVLPGLFAHDGQGPMVREAQRHLSTWTLQPVAALLAEEASEKLGAEIKIDTIGPLDAYDVGGKARALSAVIEAAARAKEAGIDLGAALRLVDWTDGKAE